MDTTILLATAPPYIALALSVYLYDRNKKDREIMEENINKADQALKEIRDHKNECNEIPKILLANQITNLDSKFESYIEDSKEFRNDVKLGLRVTGDKLDRLNEHLLRQVNK